MANGLVLLHFCVALYILLGQAAILAGALFGWQWVKQRWFRLTHLGAIALVAGIAMLGGVCPLTVWENQFRESAGQPIEQSSFIAYWAHRLLYVEIPIDSLRWWYLGFALLVASSLYAVPIRWKEKSAAQTTAGESQS